MQAEAILRVAGQVAGIGGLAVCLFLLIARYVLKALPKPDKVPPAKYFRVIDRIILFAFVLSITGLLIYAILEVGRRAGNAMEKTTELSTKLASLDERYKALSEKAENLSSENTKLQARIEQVAEAGLKARSSAIEVVASDITFDLSNWQEVSLGELKTKKRSPVITRTRRVVSRAHNESTKFAATYATSSAFEPDFSCKTHKMTAVLNKDPTPPGKESLRRWILEYEIGQEPLFTDFAIITEITGWNALQNPTTEHEGTIILFPTRTASIEVIFPKSKPPLAGSIECYSYPLAEGSKSLEKHPNLSIAADGLKAKWNIEQPRLGYHYEIHWKW